MKFYLTCLKNKNEKLLLPRLIMEVEKTNYNHVEIVAAFNNPNEHLGVPTVELSFGAVFPNSRWCTVSRLEQTHLEVERIPLNVAVSDEKALDILFKLVDKPYSPLQLVIIYAKVFLSKYLTWLPFVKLNLDAGLICTELAGIFMVEACGAKTDVSIEALNLKDTVFIAKNGYLTVEKEQ